MNTLHRTTLVVSFALLAVRSPAADLALECRVGDAWHRLAKVEKDSPWVEGPDGLIETEFRGEWRLLGDPVDQPALACWSLDYGIEHRPGCETLETPHDGMTARVSIWISDPDQKNRRQKPRLTYESLFGADHPAVPTLFAVAWIVDDKPSQTQVFYLPPSERGDSYHRIAEFELTDHELRGYPILLAHLGDTWADLGSDRSPLARAIVATVRNDANTLDGLLTEGLDPDSRDAQGMRLIHHAAQAGADACIDLLVDAGSKVNDSQQDPPLILAAMTGRASTVARLLAAGARPDAQTDTKETALLAAASRGHLEIVRLLVEAGADVDGAKRASLMPIAAAINNGFTAIADYLHAHKARWDFSTPIMSAALATQMKTKHRSMVRWLLERGVDPNRKDGDPDALSFAAYLGDTELATLLLDHGADPQRSRKAAFSTALRQAVVNGHPDIVKILVEHGVDPNGADDSGNSPLHIAALLNQHEVARTLLELGAQPTARNHNGLTPLEVALAGGCADSARILAPGSPPIAPSSKHFETFLVMAICLDIPEVVDSAVAAGWDPRQPLQDEWRPCQIARVKKAGACLNLLKNLDADDGSEGPIPVVGASDLDARVRPTNVVMPRDPRPAYSTFPASRLHIDALLDHDGTLRFMTTAEHTDPVLIATTVSALQEWRFESPTVDGKPVAVRIRIPIQFPDSKQRAFQQEEVDVVPLATRTVNPIYPVGAVQGGLQGVAVIDFVVSTDGMPTQLRVVSTSHPAFAKAAIDALKQWRFTPGRADGEPVPVRMRLPIKFFLQD